LFPDVFPAFGACCSCVGIITFKGGGIDQLVAEEPACVLLSMTLSLVICLNFQLPITKKK
jgi:hypothetical protein